MSEIRCSSCHAWFPSDLVECAACGQERPAWNRALHVGALNAGLYRQAEQAVGQEKAYRRSLAAERRTAKRLGQPFVEPKPLTARELGRV